MKRSKFTSSGLEDNPGSKIISEGCAHQTTIPFLPSSIMMASMQDLLGSAVHFIFKNFDPGFDHRS